MERALITSALLLTGLAYSADVPGSEAGQKAEQQSCVQCHSLRLVDSQRLSSVAWQKEITKMINWGAVVPDQQVLLEYLSQKYSDVKPVPAPQLSSPSKKQTSK